MWMRIGRVFGWVLGKLADRGLVKGKRVAIDATTLEANAATMILLANPFQYTGRDYDLESRM